MKTLIIDGEASRIEVKDGKITIRFADEPKAVATIPALNEPIASWELKEFSSKGGSAGTEAQRAARALNAVKATAARMKKRAERNAKPAAQVENEAAKEIIGHLFDIAKRNEEAKNA